MKFMTMEIVFKMFFISHNKVYYNYKTLKYYIYYELHRNIIFPRIFITFITGYNI